MRLPMQKSSECRWHPKNLFSWNFYYLCNNEKKMFLISEKETDETLHSFRKTYFTSLTATHFYFILMSTLNIPSFSRPHEIQIKRLQPYSYSAFFPHCLFAKYAISFSHHKYWNWKQGWRTFPLLHFLLLRRSLFPTC